MSINKNSLSLSMFSATSKVNVSVASSEATTKWTKRVGNDYPMQGYLVIFHYNSTLEKTIESLIHLA